MRRMAFITAFVVAIALPGPAVVSASERAASYDWLAGSGIVCGVAKDACPDVAEDADQTGDTIEVRAGGTLTNHPKSVDGDGTFVHRLSSGAVFARGTLTAEELLSFEDWGSSTDPSLPPEFRAGRARILVHFVVTGGRAKGVEVDGTLQVTCVLPGASGIPAGAEEGITVDIPGFLSFEHSVSGVTLFIVQ